MDCADAIILAGLPLAVTYDPTGETNTTDFGFTAYNARVYKWTAPANVVLVGLSLQATIPLSGNSVSITSFYGVCGAVTEVPDSSITVFHNTVDVQHWQWGVFHPGVDYFIVIYSSAANIASTISIGVFTPPYPPLPGATGYFCFDLLDCNGEPIPPGTTYPARRVRRFVLPFDRGLTVFLQRLEFLIQVGESDDSPIYVRLSKNGGETFGAWQTLTAGTLADYSKRVFWNVNSSGRNWVGEFVVDAPYPWYLIDACCDYEVGDN